ncbi:MAG: hypothetical protein Q8K96_08350 [Rubrivivax sp.]|nr:hypothetical protein [Rubrivivax sp.]
MFPWLVAECRIAALLGAGGFRVAATAALVLAAVALTRSLRAVQRRQRLSPVRTLR